MDLPAALDAALRSRYRVTEIRTPVTRQRGLQARMNQLEKAHKGDRKAAARAAGVTPGTWQRWRTGKAKPSKASQGKLDAAHKRLIRLPKLKRSIKAAGVPSAVNVSGNVGWNSYRNRTQYRTIKFRNNVAAVMARTIKAWAARGPEAAADAFQRGLADAENVPNTDQSPGITFDGDGVEIEFP